VTVDAGRHHAYAAAMRRAGVAALLLVLPGCSTWFFSGEHHVDRDRPVALVETTGGIEFGATTEFGVLTRGRTATSGPCRVHYFLGPTPLIETGELVAVGGGWTRAEIDLKTQHARVLDRPPTPDDELRVVWTPDGQTMQEVTVVLAHGPGVEGDALRDPGQAVPPGATVLCRTTDGTWAFVGLVTGHARVQGGPAAGDYFVFAGLDRLRELLAVPGRYPIETRPKYRGDDITVDKPVTPPAAK